MSSEIEYHIDASKTPGTRVAQVKLGGVPVPADQLLAIAVPTSTLKRLPKEIEVTVEEEVAIDVETCRMPLNHSYYVCVCRKGSPYYEQSNCGLQKAQLLLTM